MEVFKTYKQRGEWIELLFMTLAAKRGYVLLKPWGDSARYDVGIEHRGRLKRIQVKGTDCREKYGYSCHLASGKQKTYTVEQIDYLAIYVPREDIWYIFPAKRLMGQGSVMLSPHSKEGLHERYREAWGLLDSGRRGPVRAAEGGAGKVAHRRGRSKRDGATGRNVS
jgi:uncharacterized protein YifE (UPF0438 family)